jgi:diguanylate cyclase (GGDEF)-like protein
LKPRLGTVLSNFLLILLVNTPYLQGQELFWNGQEQLFSYQEVFRVKALPFQENYTDYADLLKVDVEDDDWPLMFAPEDWKSGPFPDHDGKVIYRLHLYFQELPRQAPAIYLGYGIDNEWTYFNGELIGHNGPVGENHSGIAFDVHRMYPLPLDQIREGKNVLSVVIQNYRPQGGMLRGQHWFGPLTDLSGRLQTDNLILVGLLSIYSLVALTYLLLGLRNLREPVNWSFAIFLLSFHCLFLCPLTAQILPFYRLHALEEARNDHCQPCPPAFLHYLTLFFKMKHKLVHWIFYGASFISIVLYSVLSEDSQWGAVLMNWTQPSWALLIGTVVYILWKNYRQHPDGKPLFYSIVVVILAFIYDILVSRQAFGPGNVFYIGQYTFAVFILTLSWIQASRFGRMYHQMEVMVAERTASLTEANKELTRLATRDQLTGLLNRGEWQKRLESEWERYRRYQKGQKKPFTILFLDMDNFKDVNDTFGHQAGDELLLKIGSILSSKLRTVDTSARFGGDEFVVLLPETTSEDAKVVAHKLIEAFDAFWAEKECLLQSQTERNIPKGHEVGLSLGIATIPAETELSMDEFLAKADQALYAAKEAGKGQLAVAKF